MDAVTGLKANSTIGRQSGATAVEFAFILPALVALIYSLFVYSYVYVLYESINYAAQQGAESAVAVDPSLDTDYFSTVQTYAQSTAAGVLSWLPEAQRSASVGNANGSLVEVLQCNASGGGASPYCPVAASGGTPIVVRISFPVRRFFPALVLPGIGSVPPLPESISGIGVTLLSG